ncbi:hypothetical protein Agub_g14786, partial [Astrephomene gubernaculifera]
MSASQSQKPAYFSGLAFVVHLDGPQLRGYPPDKESYTQRLRKNVIRIICSHGGNIIGLDDEYVEGATHVIATHEQQQLVQQARQAQSQGADVLVFGPQWVLSCIEYGGLVTEDLGQEWGVLPGPRDPGVPGFSAYTNHIRVSGIPADMKDLRMLLFFWVENMGGISADETRAGLTSHVLTYNSHVLTPQQQELQERQPHIRHVNYGWLLKCRHTWSLVDDEPFLLRPADPYDQQQPYDPQQPYDQQQLPQSGDEPPSLLSCELHPQQHQQQQGQEGQDTEPGLPPGPCSW